VSSFSFDSKRIAKRLAEIRTAAGLSGEGFAAYLAEHAKHEVSYVTVLSYEYDKERPNKKVAKVPAAYCMVVARAFGYSPEYVMALTDDPRPVPPDRAVAALHRILDEARRALAAGNGAKPKPKRRSDAKHFDPQIRPVPPPRKPGEDAETG
jgi:transcriptional regulator with XRE-family HTH domain